MNRQPTEDMKIQAKVPDDFPNENILVHEHEENGRRLLKIPDGYRRLDENKNLNYLFSRMVTAIHPSGHSFHREKGMKRISEIFSSSDEAFALLVIYNEIDRWKYVAKKDREKMVKEVENQEQEQQKKRKRDSNVPAKKFNNASSGEKDGWSEEGRMLYQDLFRDIEDLRNDPSTGNNPEEVLRQQFVETTDTKFSGSQNLVDGEIMFMKQELGGFVPPALRDIFATGELRDV